MPLEIAYFDILAFFELLCGLFARFQSFNRTERNAPLKTHVKAIKARINQFHFLPPVTSGGRDTKTAPLTFFWAHLLATDTLCASIPRLTCSHMAEAPKCLH